MRVLKLFISMRRSAGGSGGGRLRAQEKLGAASMTSWTCLNHQRKILAGFSGRGGSVIIETEETKEGRKEGRQERKKDKKMRRKK